MEMEDEDIYITSTDIVDYWAYLKTVRGKIESLNVFY